MLMNEKGVTWIEALYTASIIFTVILTMLPLYQIVMVERAVLLEKRQHLQMLQNHLMEFTYEKMNITYLSIDMESDNGVYTFDVNHNLIKGCVTWENAKEQMDESCLYSKR